MPGTIFMYFSGHSKYSDVCAALDSYAVELYHKGKQLLGVPLHSCSDLSEAPAFSGQTEIDKTIDLRMVQYSPAPDDFLKGIRERTTRWPFWVESPMEVCFRYGDQWWVYKFTAGKTYLDRIPPYVESESNGQAGALGWAEQCEDCQKAKKHAYSDATTPGFFYPFCMKHCPHDRLNEDGICRTCGADRRGI